MEGAINGDFLTILETGDDWAKTLTLRTQFDCDHPIGVLILTNKNVIMIIFSNHCARGN
jgi:hypothetical protein